MNNLINLIVRTIIRASIFKGMRRSGIPATIVLAVIAGIVFVATDARASHGRHEVEGNCSGIETTYGDTRASGGTYALANNMICTNVPSSTLFLYGTVAGSVTLDVKINNGTAQRIVVPYPGSLSWQVQFISLQIPTGGSSVTFTVVSGTFYPDYLTFTSDATPPSIPTNLSAIASGSDVVVSWTASTDNVGVTSYELRRDNDVPGTVTSPFTDIGMAGASHFYEVRARDTAGNFSNWASFQYVYVAPPPPSPSPSPAPPSPSPSPSPAPPSPSPSSTEPPPPLPAGVSASGSYGEWESDHTSLGKWVLYIAAVLIGIQVTVGFAIKALNR